MRSCELPCGSGVFIICFWPTVITAICVIVLVFLGTWQVERLHWKENLIATLNAGIHKDPVDVGIFNGAFHEFMPIKASGVLINEKQVFLHAISRQGEGGYHVLTPMKLDQGQILLVDRGWVPFRSRENSNFSLPKEHITIEGLLRISKYNWLLPKNDPEKGEWYWVDLAVLVPGPNTLPFFLSAGRTASVKGLPVGGQTEINLPNDHFGYAVTWYGLAAALLVIYGLSNWQRGKQR